MINIIESIVENRDFRRKLFLILGLIALILIGILVYFTFFYIKACTEKACYDESMLSCKKSSYIKEDDKATWLYNIIGNEDKSSCRIDVQLLKIKQGTIDIETLQGKNMICVSNKVGGEEPEKDISKCHGILKEEIQEILIQRMHNYLLLNVGKIEEGFLPNGAEIVSSNDSLRNVFTSNSP